MPDKSIDRLSGLGFVMPDASLDQAIQEAESLKEDISSRLAIRKYRKKAVQVAYAALARQVDLNGPEDPAYVRIMDANHPYDEMVKWHREKRAKATHKSHMAKRGK